MINSLVQGDLEEDVQISVNTVLKILGSIGATDEARGKMKRVINHLMKQGSEDMMLAFTVAAGEASLDAAKIKLKQYAVEVLGAKIEAGHELTPPCRVGCIMHTDDDAIYLIGYGTYVGNVMHPIMKVPNPKIVLDSGKTVWGCECWWHEEAPLKESIAASSKKVIEVDIDEIKERMGIGGFNPMEGVEEDNSHSE